MDQVIQCNWQVGTTFYGNIFPFYCRLTYEIPTTFLDRQKICIFLLLYRPWMTIKMYVTSIFKKKIQIFVSTAFFVQLKRKYTAKL